jgi:NAD(P)-dependent dehydrogenase (short-subunit alcohol dehydrogenase family)
MSCHPSLNGKRVLVTGAGRGIGRAIAIICSKEGARVAIASRTLCELEDTSRLMNREYVSLHIADVNNDLDVKAMVESIVSEWGGIDILINNAGAPQVSKGSFETMESIDFLSVLNCNVVSIHRVTSAVIPHMKEGGKVINVSSRAGKRALSGKAFYVASKFALEGLTAVMAEDLKERKISVNSISPGMVNTKSFPKAEGLSGVRTAESIRDGLLVVLSTNYTGRYLHVDELDRVREAGLGDILALKDINEPNFEILP